MAIVAISLLLCITIQPAGAVGVVAPAPIQPKVDSPILVTGYAFNGPKLLYVQLFNSSNEVIAVENWAVEYTISGQLAPVEVGKLSGNIKPGGYVVVGEKASTPAADFGYEIAIPDGAAGNVNGIKLIPAGNYAETAIVVKSDASLGYWKRNISASTGSYLSTFSSFVPDSTFVLYGKGLYEPAETATLQFTEILANPRNCSPLEQAGECLDFVKFYNPTSLPVDLSQFRLRVGYFGQNATSNNTFVLAGVVPAGGYFTTQTSADNRPISLTNSGSYVWLEDTYGMKRYDATVTEYPDASSDTKKGQAWAYDITDGTWKWTLQPNAAHGASIFVLPEPPKPKVTAASLTPCKEGQYRSEETNRCRSLATATTALAPCDDDEERNPATNRCRKIASLTNQELVPCKEGQERNPETNRCRNIAATSPPDTAFKAEPIAETGKAFMGWWALGGVGLLAVGYGIWEWRQEMLGAVQKVASFFTLGK